MILKALSILALLAVLPGCHLAEYKRSYGAFYVTKEGERIGAKVTLEPQPKRNVIRVKGSEK